MSFATSLLTYSCLVSHMVDSDSTDEIRRHTVFLSQGPVVQSVVSLTSLLRVILLIVLADSIYNILIFFAEKM